MNMNTDNRVSPQAPEIEEAILGACLIEQEAMPLVADTLRPEMFYSMRHRDLRRPAGHVPGRNEDRHPHRKRRTCPPGQARKAGGAFGITQLSSKVATSAHIEYHMQIVHEKYLRREMILGLNKLLACSLDETMDIADTLIDAHNLLDRLEGEFGHNDHMRDMDALMTDTMEEAEQRIAKSVNGITGIPTGLTDLNRMTSGLQNGELIAIAAPLGRKDRLRPSIWRGRLPCRGHAVAVYSLEMQGERLADRWLLSASDINPTAGARHP